MSDFKPYRQASKTNWGTEKETLTLEEIRVGAILRIADATEKMAQNYDQLLRDRNNFKRWYEEERKAHRRTARSNAALRGYIKRLKVTK